MTHPNMMCPVCAVPLTMSERQNVEIDYCPQCRGVWLDRGELDKIIERASAENVPSAPPPEPRVQSHAPQQQYAPPPQHYGYDPRYKYKRKKSFLEELFD